MRKIQRLIAIFALSFIIPTQVMSQSVRQIPIYFHIMDNGTSFTSFLAPGQTIGDYLANVVCKVNEAYSGTDANMLAAISSGVFPSSYIPRIANTKLHFVIKGITHHPGYYSGAQTVPQGLLGPGYAINVFLYDFAASPSSDPTGRYVGTFSTTPLTVAGGIGLPQRDIILLRSSAFLMGFDDVRGTLAHEIGHFFGLKHLENTAIVSSTCWCASGSDDCCTDTPPAFSTYSCNMADNVSMSQNVMQEGSSCRVFLTNNQKALIDNSFVPGGALPCRRTDYIDPSPALGLSGHVLPPLTWSFTSGILQINASYSTMCPGLPVKFIATVARYEAPVVCLEGFTITTGSNPSTVLTALIGTNCTYRVAVRAIWSDGSFYDYTPYVYVGSYETPIECACSIYPGGSPSQRPAGSGDATYSLDNAIMMNEGDVLDVDALLNSKHNMVASLSNLEVFPNPAESTISFRNIDATGFKYKITNVVGQVVDEGTMKSNKIAVEKLTAGQYFVQITGKHDNLSNVMKFVKTE